MINKSIGRASSMGSFLKTLNYVAFTLLFLLTANSLLANNGNSNDQSNNSTTEFFQEITVTGTVTDATSGEPMVGTAVTIEGTTIGQITDIDGNYSINVPDGNAVLVFQFVGYNIERVPVGNQTTINVSLAPSIESLDEVVVVGYGTQTKRTVTGAIQNLDAEELTTLPVTTTAQKLQGKLSGVQINQTTGKPGEGMKIRVRGQASITAGNEPLYVVDGFPIDGNIDDLNPNDIESISVLKDAASTSLYGSRAANGVIMVTTKRGEAGKIKVNFSTYFGMQVLPEHGRPDIMNATEFAQFKKEFNEDRGLPVPAIFQNPEEYGEGTDWYDVMFRNALIEDYSLSISGGTDRFTTSVMAGYFYQEGIMLNSGYERYSIRSNSDYKVNDYVKIGINLAPTVSKRHSPNSDGLFWAGGLLNNALLAWPIYDPYERDADGNLPLGWGTDYSIGKVFATPNYVRSATEMVRENEDLNFLSNAYISVEPIKGLVVKSTLNYQLGYGNGFQYNPSTAGNSLPPVQPAANYSDRYSTNWIWENTATYSKSIGNHDIEVLGGYSAQKFLSKTSSISVTNFPVDGISDVDAANVLNTTGTDSDQQEWSLLSYIGRFNYSYMGKYLFSAAIRRDGSSRFGLDNRWGNFPSVSVGWIASEEDFFPKTDVLYYLKLRGSYGITGNNNIGNYTQAQLVNIDNKVVFGGIVSSGTYVNNISNPTLGWEKTDQLDIGFDLGLLNNRISVAYDYYLKHTTDLLYQFAIPRSSGFTTYQGNSGEFKFWGHELLITSRNLVGDFKWTTNFNIARNDNEVISLEENVNEIINNFPGGHITRVGERIGLFYGLIQDGIVNNQAELDVAPLAPYTGVGTINFVDINGDGRIIYSPEAAGGDQTIIGDPTPKFIYGMTNTFNYKNFDLSISMSGSYGNDISNRFEIGSTNLDGVFNILAEVKDRWRSPENPGAGKYGTTNYGANMERDYFHTRFLQDGSYLTIKNITLGYNLNSDVVKFVENLRVYLSIQQVWTFTKYTGNNVEVSGSAFGASEGPQAATVMTLGDDFGSYPVPRTFTLGVNMNF